MTTSLRPDAALPRLAIIADDLTGALDAAAPFAGRGLTVAVALSPADMTDAVATGAEVVSVSTRSREIAPEAARQAVAEALAALPAGTPLFKKIDSRMKGNIAAELSAIGAAHALCAPAIPDFGRMVKNGHVTGFGVADPIAIAPLLGMPATVPDTDSLEQMLAALEATPDALPVGARGLAEALARRMTGSDAAEVPPLSGPRGTLVIGSRDPITMAQVAALSGVTHVEAPNGVLTEVPTAAITVIQATQGAAQIDGTEVAANLARGLQTLPRPDTLFLTGGATAEAVLTALGVRTLRLLGECLPGLPVARAQDMTIVAKSGGFGTADTLAEVVRKISKAV